MPWLYYGQDPTKETDIKLQATFDSKPVQNYSFVQKLIYKDATHISHLEFVVAAYHLNGSFAGFQQLDSQIQLCTFDGNGNPDAFLRFGAYYKDECYFDLSTLLYNLSSTLFYDLCMFSK